MDIDKVRDTLVEPLKDKIRNEISTAINMIREEQSDRENVPYDCYVYGCQIVALYSYILKYINSDSVFNACSYTDETHNQYYIRNSTLQMWLQPDFNWCRHWMESFGLGIYPCVRS